MNEDHRGEASTYDSLGYIQHQLGDYSEAITSYSHAARMFEGPGANANLATVLTHLGETHKAIGDLATTRSTWERALGILDVIHHADAAQIRALLKQLG